ncbi:MAG: hypothetical protein NVS4B3_16990 [Gemmatimonadaceae bacterium]
MTGSAMSVPAPPRPTPGTTRPYQFPRCERLVLANGFRVVVAPVHKLPLVSVVLVVDAGAPADQPGREGTAQLTARMLLEGTRRVTGAELTVQFEQLGATVDTSADRDAAVGRLTVMSARLDAALALFGHVVCEPAFPERELTRLKAERVADLLQLATEPGELANEMFSRFLYAPSSRYARPDGGDRDTVTVIERPDVVALHAARYHAGAMTLILAGDVTVERGRALAEATFGGLPRIAPSPLVVDDRPARHTRAAVLIAKSDAPQSELRIGHLGVPRAHPDFFSLTILNAVLGGLFSSRINLNLRERHAYTYGAHSAFDWRRAAGPFEVSTAVRSDVSAAAAREIVGEIERVRTDEVTAGEISLATSYLDGVFPIRYETTGAIAAALANQELYGLPADYFDSYRARIRAVTAQQVLEVARTHLHPDELQMVVVGDPAVVRVPLETLGFGPLSIVEAGEMLPVSPQT